MRKIGGSRIKKNILVDAGNLAFRSHYVAEKRPKEFGYLTSYYFIKILNDYLRILSPFDRICVFWDGSSKFRKSLYPSYKETRQKTEILNNPCSLVYESISISKEKDFLQQSLKSLGCDQFYSPDHEADDLIASFIKNHENEINIVISDDRDFFQLLRNPRVVLYRPTSREMVDHSKSFDVLPKLGIRYCDLPIYKIFYGDPSDNIRGIPRLFKRYAFTLCSFDNIQSILSYENLPVELEIILKTHIELIELNDKLIRFITDMEVTEFLNSGSYDIKLYNSIYRLLSADIPKSDQYAIRKDSILPEWYAEL